MKRKIIYVDIDGTICTISEGADYNKAKPILKRINHINKLYDEGHLIIYWTARGGTTGKDWTDITEKQLKEWGANYHTLICNKPAYDIFIDDKAFNSEEYFKKL